MQVLHVCSELFPLLKTGGLADVTGALPPALKQLGADTRVLVPGFPAIRAGIEEAGEVAAIDTFAGHVRVIFGRVPENGLELYVIDAPGLYDRSGNPYLDPHQEPYGDNHLRFALLAWVAAELASGLDAYWRPQIVHGHDWHAGLVPAYLAARGRPAKSVFTVHNLAYQGVFPAWQFGELRLPGHFFGMHGLEFHGQMSFLKAGLFYADHITTVSPTYAREITTPEQGCGLDGLLRDRAGALTGILNGVDDAIWNPAADALIPANYTADKPQNKTRNKLALQEHTSLQSDADAPLFVVVSRLTEQKGLHLVLDLLPELVASGAQFALLGSGDQGLEHAFATAALRDPGQVAVQIGYDEAQSHRLMAAADVVLVPSRFEPCGLTQLYGLKYGALPLVRRVGGLADTVVDSSLENMADEQATGFVFDEFSAHGMRQALRRALALWGRPKDWKAVRQVAMKQDFGWDAAARSYFTLYEQLLA
ncbi:glycogen synthase GlgA [Silvimonas iriomotensis]|uniref:Glycogen synthase n=1 Tax=Silvimonas iriomotensis TaxID=449662 RepID=A0ABQ2P9M5_9NEIS|nr:glycogen synthase GlgA [Silvimonas iriomotensis]GGP21311.1 glycogen synthase [Silvimonas iriomotensis]